MISSVAKEPSITKIQNPFAVPTISETSIRFKSTGPNTKVTPVMI